MRSSLFVVVSALLLPWSSFAQVPSIVESSALEARPHHWKQVLRNQSRGSLVAYTVGCNPKRDSTTLEDALLGVGGYVSPGESTEVGIADPSICEAGVRAAIFSDGHVEGDPEFVEELFAHRRGAFKALGETIDLLASVYSQHVPLADVLDRLSRKSNGGKTQEENEGYSFALLQVKQVLAQPRVKYGFPPDNLGQGQQFPSIEEVMNANAVSRDEAKVILLNKRLEAWKSLLVNNLQPPR